MQNGTHKFVRCSPNIRISPLGAPLCWSNSWCLTHHILGNPHLNNHAKVSAWIFYTSNKLQVSIQIFIALPLAKLGVLLLSLHPLLGADQPISQRKSSCLRLKISISFNPLCNQGAQLHLLTSKTNCLPSMLGRHYNLYMLAYIPFVMCVYSF